MHIWIRLTHFYIAILLCFSLVHSTLLSTCYCLTCLTSVLFTSFAVSSLKVDRWGERHQGLDHILFASYLHRHPGHRHRHVFIRVLSFTWLPLRLLWECWIWGLQGIRGVRFHHAGPVHCQGYSERWPPTFYRCQSSQLAEVRGGGALTGP